MLKFHIGMSIAAFASVLAQSAVATVHSYKKYGKGKCAEMVKDKTKIDTLLGFLKIIAVSALPVLNFLILWICVFDGKDTQMQLRKSIAEKK